MWRDLGLTLVLVTHDTAIAQLAQRVGVMSKGQLSIRGEAQHPAAAADATARPGEDGSMQPAADSVSD